MAPMPPRWSRRWRAAATRRRAISPSWARRRRRRTRRWPPARRATRLSTPPSWRSNSTTILRATPGVRRNRQFSLSLASGRLSFVEKSAALEGVFDLRDGGLTLALSIAAQKTPPNATAPPRGKVVWSGAWSAPVRRVDATGFVNAVAMRALEREQARIEVLRAQDRARLRALSAPQGAVNFSSGAGTNPSVPGRRLKDRMRG